MDQVLLLAGWPDDRKPLSSSIATETVFVASDGPLFAAQFLRRNPIDGDGSNSFLQIITTDDDGFAAGHRDKEGGLARIAIYGRGSTVKFSRLVSVRPSLVNCCWSKSAEFVIRPIERRGHWLRPWP